MSCKPVRSSEDLWTNKTNTSILCWQYSFLQHTVSGSHQGGEKKISQCSHHLRSSNIIRVHLHWDFSASYWTLSHNIQTSQDLFSGIKRLLVRWPFCLQAQATDRGAGSDYELSHLVDSLLGIRKGWIPVVIHQCVWCCGEMLCLPANTEGVHGVNIVTISLFLLFKCEMSGTITS